MFLLIYCFASFKVGVFARITSGVRANVVSSFAIKQLLLSTTRSLVYVAMIK